MTQRPASSSSLITQNLLAGLTVSFVAISLGAAFGILSGRGAGAGIISAGIIALVTSAFGGTRIQCSGPTAPMTAVIATVVSFARIDLGVRLPGVDPDHFINFVLLIAALLLVTTAALRLGRFIRLVPKVVISGFMNGIAILIWVDQLKKLLGVGGKTALTGPMVTNVSVALFTFAVALMLPTMVYPRLRRLGRFLPPTLVSLVGMTVLVSALGLDIERVHLRTAFTSWASFATMVNQQIPVDWTMSWLPLALAPAFQLAVLCYLDTLLTSLVIDKMTGEPTGQNKELAAQGLGMGLVALVGGIPGAQATIRSVLILKERATMRLAGVIVGVFVLVEMVLFRDAINLIPQAVFAGILFKVGYDVFDWQPVRLYVHALVTHRRMRPDLVAQHREQATFVSHEEMLFIAGTTAVTILWNLNAAVIGFTGLFYLVRRFRPLLDLAPAQTEGMADEG